jgi:hypothetical protein
MGMKKTDFGLGMPVEGSAKAEALPRRASKEIDHES